MFAVRMGLASATLLLVGPAADAASPCGRPDLIDMIPVDGASGVPVDARLTAHYAPSAEHLGEPVTLIRVPPAGPPEEWSLEARWSPSEGLLSVDPPEPLAPASDYVVRWPVLRGLHAAAPGNGGEARFSTGDRADGAPPEFAGIGRIRWDVERTHSDCDDAIEERMVFELELEPAGDDGGIGSLGLVVFQTAGPNVGGGPVPVLARAFPADGRARVALTVGDATGRVCFAALARDATGKTSMSGDRETCRTTTAPPFFEGCTAAGPGATTGSGSRTDFPIGAALAFAALLVRPPRRRRPTRW